MKAIMPSGWGRQTRLVLTDVDEPAAPGPEDVLVAVHAASVNPKDRKLNLNVARWTPPVVTKRFPPVFGDDLAGIVIEKGANVEDFDVGDAVYGMDMRPRTATLAERTRIHQTRIARMPPSLSFEEAAAMPLAAQTALQGLRQGHAGFGRSVLIIGASGGVGTFAVQIANAMGAHVTGVCSHRNTDFVKALGADAVIDYTAGDYRTRAGPFDLVFDVTSYESPTSCAALTGRSGYFISTGGDARSMVGTPFYRLLGKKAGTVVVESYREDLETLFAMVESGQLKPVIDSTFELIDANGAYDRNGTGRCRGKVVIRGDGEADDTSFRRSR
ncbi:alcohol dehydrogenase [Tamilnaduibacter salinus]|uniref:Alcohol dehydrogenase n=1 Tax=Tamilnaduibacter salinus TaxID=1484056 RepID=A0A2A2I733_9GAMM|nr:NAD(P)-dependent alcohol dehydrogenase [Tamilnaduibacter salinus]PAV26843.1 alcohol dehydrogenase [Tamilnaduibacter salinus]PVY77514.1 alcohol dehydrogenase [Tamilnaduibacter salinus]